MDYIYDEWNLIKEALQISIKQSESDIKFNFKEIDLVIANFYPFEKTISQTKNQKKIIENIDIGGPTMIRAAAKNYKDVTVITNVSQYKSLIKNINQYGGSTSLEFREHAALEAFGETAYYESLIYNYFDPSNKLNLY